MKKAVSSVLTLAMAASASLSVNVVNIRAAENVTAVVSKVQPKATSKVQTKQQTGPVMNFSVTDKTDTTVQFTWTKVKNASKLEIKQSNDNGKTWSSAYSDKLNMDSAKIISLNPYTLYKFKLAVTIGNNVFDSNIVDCKTDIQMSALSKPEVKLTKEHGDIILKWKEIKSANYYQVKRKANDGEYVIADEDVEDGFYADGDIESGSKYSYIVTAVNVFGKSDANEVSTEFTAPMDFLGTLTENQVTVYTNKATQVTFQINLTSKIANLNGVQLIDADSIDKKVIGTMYDDGNANNGDNVKGDGVYSCIITVNKYREQDLHFRAFVNTNIDDAMKDIYSKNTLTLNVVAKFTNDEIVKNLAVMNDISNKYKELLKSNKSKDEIIKEMLDYIKQNPEVVDSGFSGGSIWYKLKSKIQCFVRLNKMI